MQLKLLYSPSIAGGFLYAKANNQKYAENIVISMFSAYFLIISTIFITLLLKMSANVHFLVLQIFAEVYLLLFVCLLP